MANLPEKPNISAGNAKSPTDNATEKKEDGEESAGGAKSIISTLTSPEAILMLGYALLLDTVGICLNLLLGLNIITDLFGLATIGPWGLMKTGDMSAILQNNKKKGGTATDATGEIIKKIAGKFGVTFLIKIIPEVGSFFSFWTYRVWKILREN